MYTTKTPNPDIFTVTFTSVRHRTGWFSIAFTQNKTMENALTVLAYVNETGTSVSQMTNNSTFHGSRVVEKEVIMSKVAWERDMEKVYNMFTFEFKINASQLLGRDFVAFAINTQETPTSIGNLGMHHKIAYRPFLNIRTSINSGYCGYLPYDSSNRFDVKFIETFVIEMVILSVNLFLIIALSRVQPMKSRVFAPFVCCVAYMVSTIIQFIINRVPIEANAGYVCNLSTFLASNIQVTGYLFSVLNWFRYFVIINLNNFKMRFWDIRDGKVKISWIFLLLERISSSWGITIFSLVTVFIAYSPFVIGGIPFGFQCQSFYFYIQSGFNLLYFLIIGFSLLVMILLDVILNWRKIIKCQLRNFYVTSDPYLFRLEKLTFPLMFALFVLGGALNNPIVGLYLTPPLANTFIQTIWFHWITILDVYFITTATLIRFLFCRRKKVSGDGNLSPLEEIFANQDLRRHFFEYCKNEWSIENALIKKDIEKFKLLSGNDQQDLAKSILSQYLNGTSSVMAVNITDSLVVPVRDAITKGAIKSDMFGQIEESINANLLDTFNRFRWTPEYTTWKGIQKKQQELLQHQ